MATEITAAERKALFVSALDMHGDELAEAFEARIGDGHAVHDLVGLIYANREAFALTRGEIRGLLPGVDLTPPTEGTTVFVVVGQYVRRFAWEFTPFSPGGAA